MNVLVDTTVWSLALRRRTSDLSQREMRIGSELAELVRDGRVVMIGPIRQELLSRVRSEPLFERLRERLRAFPDERLMTDDFEEAGRSFNACRSAGITGSAVDLLICAVALRRRLAIFTTDPDFERCAAHLPLSLHVVRGAGSST